jgi:drug/metabolite transporter (DMT)-like permease
MFEQLFRKNGFTTKYLGNDNRGVLPLMAVTRSQNAGYLSILLAIFFWSSLGVVVRLSGVEGHVLIFYSLLVSVILQGTIALKKKYRSELSGLNKLSYPFVLGFFLMLNNLFFYYAFQHTTIANTVLTHYTAPIIVAFLASAFLGERVSWKLLTAIAVASAGLWILLNGFNAGEAHAYGIAAGLASGVSYAIIIILSRSFSVRFSPVVLSFWSNTFIVVMLLPFVREFPAQAWGSFLVMGVLHSTVAPILYFKGLQTVTANRAAVLGYLEPVSAILFSMLFLNEKPGIYSVFGGVLILFSGYLTVRGEE